MDKWDRFPCNNGQQLQTVILYHKEPHPRPHKGPRSSDDDNNGIETSPKAVQNQQL